MLMKISIEGPKTLEDEKLYRIIDIETETKKTSCLNYCYYGEDLGGGGGKFIGFGGEVSSVPPHPLD